MRIDSNVITMYSEHKLEKSYSKEESLKMWVGNERPNFEGGSMLEEAFKRFRQDIVQISDMAKQKLAKSAQNNTLSKAESEDEVGIDLSEKDKEKILLIETFIETLTGKECKIQVPACAKLTSDGLDVEIDDQIKHFNRSDFGQRSGGNERQGWGVEYDALEIYSETENLIFKAGGLITTKDGDSINFLVEFSMSRSYYEESRTSIRAGDAVKKIDPLIINLDGGTISLTDVKYNFDLNADGKRELVSFVNSGSGFLTIDKNEDGIVNDGSELFGPRSGNGFMELSQYDEDGNHWIDEADSIYDKLRIWTKDAAGNNQLFALGQVGVGAIYLGNIQTPFELKNDQNTLNGLLNRTGLYLGTDKTVKTIQQVDLTA